MNKKLAYLSVLMAGVFWGTMGIFVRYFSMSGLAAMEIGEIRIAVGLILVGVYLLLFHRDYLFVRLKDLWIFVGSGVGSLLLMMYTQFSAMQYSSIAVASVLLYTAPVFVMLLSALLFRERITCRKVVTLVMVFAGCVLVSGIGSKTQVSTPGVLLGIASGLAYSLYSIFGRFAVNRGYNSWTITFYSFVFCVLAGAVFSNWTHIGAVFTAPKEFVWALLMGLVTAFAPFLLYSLGLAHMESSHASMLATAEPVVAALVSIFVFSEPISSLNIVGMVLILVSIILISVIPEKKSIIGK